MLFKSLKHLLPLVSLLFVAGIVVHALVSNAGEANQWPRRLARFLWAVIAGAGIFLIVYLAGGFLIGKLGYTYGDKPLLRLAHLVCVLAVYPSALAAAIIFRTRHVSLLLGISLALVVHLLDKTTYLGMMVFSDPALALNGDFVLTNMALMFVTSILGGESGLRVTFPWLYASASRDGVELEAQNHALT